MWLLKHSTDAVLGLLRLGGAPEATVTEEEVKALIAEGTQAGVFAPEERAMIDGVLRLADRTVRAVMTPRLDVVWIDRAAGRDELVAPGRDAPPPAHPGLRRVDRPCRRLHRHGRHPRGGAPRRGDRHREHDAAAAGRVRGPRRLSPDRHVPPRGHPLRGGGRRIRHRPRASSPRSTSSRASPAPCRSAAKTRSRSWWRAPTARSWSTG